QLDEDARIGDARPDLLVEIAEDVELDRVVVLVEEGLDPLAQLQDAVRRREVHWRGGYRGYARADGLLTPSGDARCADRDPLGADRRRQAPPRVVAARRG